MNDLHKALIHLAYCERESRSSLIGGNCIKERLLELVEAAKMVRKVYMKILESDNQRIDEFKTKPVIEVMK